MYMMHLLLIASFKMAELPGTHCCGYELTKLSPHLEVVGNASEAKHKK